MLENSLKILEFDRMLRVIKDFAVSSYAKDKATELRPFKTKKDIELELDKTEEAFEILMKNSTFHISGIYNISNSLNLSKMGSCLNTIMLLDIANTLRSMRLLVKSIKNMQNDRFKTPHLMEKVELIGKFKKLEDDIFSVIISEEQISDNASPKLARIRKSIESKKDSIRKKLESLVSSEELSKYLQDSIITLRGDRFVVPVKSEHKTRISGLVHDKSRGGSTFYIEPQIVVNLNNELKSLYVDEREEINRILYELTGMVAERADDIYSSYIMLCEIDFIFAKAKLAHKYNCFKPVISDKKEIVIKNARHPLLESKSVVPLNFSIGTDYNAVIITGPNTGGKTVSLKTIGLLTMLALSGNYVPATSSRFGLYDYILADIGDEQSIDQSLSTFSSHMKNIVNMLDIASNRALLLFDELGAGTDPTEGAALAISILNKVQKLGATVVATTHYSELKHFALVTSGFVNASVEFDVDKLMPTYRLSIGVPGKSNAFEISRRLGLSDEIINDAKNSILDQDIIFEDVLTSIEKSKFETEKMRDEISRKLLEIKKKEEKINDKSDIIERQKERILNDAKEEAMRLIKNAREVVEEAVKNSKNFNSNSSKDVLIIKQKLTAEENKNKKKHISEKTIVGEKPKDYKIGKDYFVKSLNQTATLVEISKDKARVKAGIISSYVDIKELYIINNEKQKKSKNSIFTAKNTMGYGTTVNVTKSGKMEIDLHGKDTLTAVHEVDKFLDEAIVSGLNNVRIIHGVGSGKLKRAVREHLKNLKCVKKFRDGGEREGGMGVTVVSFY
ncbi:MAG: endonuclease MutS2 [Clostridiales bacterium]|nr:MAG: endonuclease MutS2 [Clostridiales bacterium]